MVIYWHKRDLRLLDNPALCFAVELSREQDTDFIPILGLETDLIDGELTHYEFSEFHQYGYLSAILPLYQNYNYFGIQPILFQDSILNVLHKIQSHKPIYSLVTHQEHGTNETYKRDKSVKDFCNKHGITWYQLQPSGVIRNLENRDKRDAIVKEYLSGKILTIPDFSSVSNFQTKNLFDSEKTFKDLTLFQQSIASKYTLQQTSEKNALSTIDSFATTRASGYRGGISSPNKAMISGSRLSQYIAYGSVSLRYIHQFYWTKIKSTSNTKLKSGMLGSMQRLHWREHFVQRIETEPTMPTNSINPYFNKISYTHDPDLFNKYKTGTTGEILIDACIRCLNVTGFINFRMRAMLVSYGVFGLDLDWRELGRYLATVFLDYEPGIHWSQIQMQSGVTGINMIRVYSPHKQLLDQDPDCIFVRKWIPALASLTNEQILDYPNISLSNLTDGKYPDPAVDFKAASKVNKAKTFGAKKSSTKETSKKVFTVHGSRKKRPTKKLTKTKPKTKAKSLSLFD
jgi:deoxyribodipyrimidine photo-lyase